MNNQLNLIFGPRLPPQFESVGLAFVTTSLLKPDSSVAALSAERYERHNYDHVETGLNFFSDGGPGCTLDIQYSSPSIGYLPNTSGFGVGSVNGQATLSSDSWTFPIINTAITVKGIQISKANSWHPIINPGTVWRGYSLVRANEAADSWLTKAFSLDEDIILIYNVPEANYGATTSNVPTNFPPATAKYTATKEIGSPTGPTSISYAGDLQVLQELKINGVIKYTGSFVPGTSDAYILGIDPPTKTISISNSIGPDDYIELTYLSYSEYYCYTGFRNAAGTWFPFDMNPEYGHIIADDSSASYFLSSDCLMNQVTLYLIPSAAIKVTYTTPTSSGDSNYLGTLQLSVYRAIDYGETHYVRHAVADNTIESIVVRDGTTVINTWGYSTLGRNYYDESSQFINDTFSTRIPCMLPLGKMLLTAPISVKSVAVADLRERGGGVPLNFPMAGVDTQSDGLDKLRGFFDLGIWEGKAVKTGGVIEVQIDSSVLKTDPTDTDPTKFLSSEIYTIVKSRIPPGIDFQIVYLNGV